MLVEACRGFVRFSPYRRSCYTHARQLQLRQVFEGRGRDLSFCLRVVCTVSRFETPTKCAVTIYMPNNSFPVGFPLHSFDCFPKVSLTQLAATQAPKRFYPPSNICSIHCILFAHGTASQGTVSCYEQRPPKGAGGAVG